MTGTKDRILFYIAFWSKGAGSGVSWAAFGCKA